MLIELWNKDVREYFKYLSGLFCTEEEAIWLLGRIQAWIEETDYQTYLNSD